jgi:predicted nicotinamide N-methyase
MGKSSRNFDIPKSSSGETVHIKLDEPALAAENLRLTTWGSSFILATRLHRFALDWNSLHPAASSSHASDNLGTTSISVLELGAGTGLVGISAAAIWNTNVVLSDLAPIVPGLAVNICTNRKNICALGGSAFCGTLDWANPDKLVLHSIDTEDQRRQERTLQAGTNKATVILAADTIYSEEHPAMLSSTILRWLKHGPDARVIIAYPMRVAYLDEIRGLWELLQHGGLEAIDEGRELVSDDWDDEALHEWSVWRWKTGEGNH